jgi:hypothetical protein
MSVLLRCAMGARCAAQQARSGIFNGFVKHAFEHDFIMDYSIKEEFISQTVENLITPRQCIGEETRNCIASISVHSPDLLCKLCFVLFFQGNNTNGPHHTTPHHTTPHRTTPHHTTTHTSAHTSERSPQQEIV